MLNWYKSPRRRPFPVNDQNTLRPEQPIEQFLNVADTKACCYPAQFNEDQTTEQKSPEAALHQPPREITQETPAAAPQKPQDLIPQSPADAAAPDLQENAPSESRSAAIPPVDTVPQEPNTVVSIPESDGTKEKSKILPIILAAVAACLVLAVGVTGFMYYNRYKEAQDFAKSGRYGKAQDTLILPFLTEFHDPEFVQYLEAGVLFTDGDYTGAEALLQSNPNYRDSAELLQKISYLKANAYLEQGDYERARELLESLANQGYSNADILLQQADYAQGRACLEQGNHAKAMQYLEPLAENNYLDSLQLYYEAKLAYALERIDDTDNINSVKAGFAYLNGLIEENYSPAYAALSSAQETVYQFAISLYEDYRIEASDYFDLVKDYSRAKDYLTLCSTYDYSTTLEELWALRGFANADELLYSQEYLCRFLVGSWYTSNKNYYCIMEDMDEASQYDYYFSYNLPWQYSGDFEIIDGILKVFHNGSATSLNEFRFTINSWNQITVYCYKNGSSYTLYRS